MIENWIRPTYHRLVIQPLLPALKNISPNTLTVLSLILGIAAGWSIAIHHTFWAICFLLLSGFLDSLDGSLARFLKQTSNSGCVLDIFADRVVESSVVLGLFWVSPATRAIPIIFIFASMFLCITSFLIVSLFENKKSEKGLDYSTGIMERLETFIFFFAMIIWPYWFVDLAYLFSTLVLLTAGLRLYAFFQSEKNSETFEEINNPPDPTES